MASGPDILIVGSGMGGATLAAALAPTGRRILILERGERMADCPEARDAGAIFSGHFQSDERWYDAEGTPFAAANHYVVGGNSKFYGASLIRFRAEDFTPRSHAGGSSPGWPISYDDLAPFYDRAEALFQVRGAVGSDPSEPPHKGDYPHPPVPHEPDIAWLVRQLRAQGLNPSPIPLGVDLDRWLAHGRTPWDGHPDTCGGKMDAETSALAAALRHQNVELRTNTRVEKIGLGPDGSVIWVRCNSDGNPMEFRPAQLVLAAGAVNTAALLLGSASEAAPQGIANGSDQVGRNFMNHNCSAVMALNPLRRNGSVYQKTLQINDFYNGGGPANTPLGNIQMLGKITAPILQVQANLPRALARWIAARSFDFYAMSEDLPHPESRVTVKEGRIFLNWRRTNEAAHTALVARLKRICRRAGLPIVLSRRFDSRTPSHQCGTARMGLDPSTSVVSPAGQSHDHPNLWIADASVLPTSAAVNPALTIAAQAMRTAEAMAHAPVHEKAIA